MSFRARAGGVLRWFLGAAKGTLYPLDANGEETALAVSGVDGRVLTEDSTAEGGMSWQDAAGGGGCVPEILVDDVSGEILFDDVTGDILYDDTACVGGGGGGASTLDGLSDVVLTSPAEGDRLEYDGTQWVNASPTSGASAEGQDTADATTYVATTGNDTTGDGSSGAPYATIAKALATLPRSLGYVQTIDVADGTYAEAIAIQGVVCTGAGKILITGNPTTPANVVVTGTVSSTVRGETLSAAVLITGDVQVELEGVKVNATADHGIWAYHRARLVIDRCLVTGTLTRGIVVWHQSKVEFQGNITVSGFSARGVQLSSQSQGMQSTAGTLTITGPASGTSYGLQASVQSQFGNFSTDPSGMNVTITGVTVGVQVGLCSIVTFQSPSSTLTCSNVSTPGSSSAVLGTDCSSFSGSCAMVFDHFSVGFEVNSISYAESSGSRTWTNLGTNTSTAGNSVAALL